MPGHLSRSRSWSCVGAFEPRVLRWPKSNACAWGKPRAVGQPHSGTGWAGEDRRSHWKQILPETESQVWHSHPSPVLDAPLGHTGGCCCERNRPALRSAQPLESSHGISDRAFSSAGSVTPWHVDGSHPSVTPDNSLLSSSCRSWGGRTQFLDPSLVSNSFMINTIYLQVKATKRSPPRKVIPEVL